jgi:hypothetical protein
MARKRKVPGTRKPKRRIRLRVIPEPEPNSRSIIRYTGEGTVAMRGSGDIVMECGNCGSPLIDGVPMKTLINIVFICSNCGAYNETLV